MSASKKPAHLFLIFLIPCVVFFFFGCRKSDPLASINPLDEILNSEDTAIATVMDSPEKYEIQIRYSRIRRSADSLNFTHFDYQVDAAQYFYPASTVKFPIAVAALEKLNEIDSLDRNTRFYIEGDSVENTFAEDIVKIFAVSDNHANNRLFEFLGQDNINQRIQEKKAGPLRISHRLGFHRDDRATQPLVLYLNDTVTTLSEPIHNQPALPLDIDGILKGKGYYEKDSLVMEPFDFALKNYLPVSTLHGLMQRVIFPEYFPPDQRFNLSADQRDFLLSTMKILPREAGYDPEQYPDGYCKFFLYGDTKQPIADHIEIYNKVGFAYGTLTDCAYIRDTQTGVEFILTATILVNKDGIFNDDVYEYDTVGLPFLAALGRELYQYELAGAK